jgi:hypothetical protein
MINGKLQIQAFAYGTGDGQNPSGEPVKVLAFREHPSGAEFVFVFTPEEFDKFIQTISGGSIVVAHELPKIITQ